MRIVFMGTADFAVPSLRALTARGHNIGLVVTQPDRPAGRGRKLRPPAVKVAAEELGLSITQPEKVNTIAARAEISVARPEVIVVAAFGQILRPKLLAIPPRGCLNVHASILPRHRGAAPINAAILHGDDEVGVSIMKMDEGLDTGDVALIGRLPALPRETAPELHDRLAPLGGELIVDALDRLVRSELTFEPQDDDLSTYASMLKKTDGRIDFRDDAVTIDRRVRGLLPWPGASADLVVADGDVRRLGIARAELVAPDDEANAADSSPASLAGTILDTTDGRLFVQCGRGRIAIDEVRPAGRRAMSVRDFLNGQTITPNESRFAVGDDDA